MAHYFIHYAQQIETCSDEAQRVHLMATLDEDYANIRVALEWSIANDPLVALRLVVALDRFWYRRGYLSECRRWLTQVLALPLPGSALPFQAKAWRMCGEMANNLGDYAEAECCLHKALSAFQQLNDDCSICATFNSLGNLAADQRRSEQAIAYYEQGLAIARRLQHDHWIVNLLSNLGLLYDDMGEYDRAEELLRQNVMLSEQLDNQFGRAVSWLNLGMTLHHRGQYQAAVTYLEGSVKLCRELQELPALATALCGLAAVCLALGDTGAAQAPLRESLDLWRRARDQLGICYALEIFAQLAIMCGEPQRAIVWLDMASQIRSTIGAPRSAFDQALFERLSQQIQPLRALDPPPSRSSPAWSVEWILDDVQEWDDFVSALRFGAEGVSE
jgi:serine/threonine-protein kinase PknK